MSFNNAIVIETWRESFPYPSLGSRCEVFTEMLSFCRILSWRWSWSPWRESWQRNRSYSCLHRMCHSLIQFLLKSHVRLLRHTQKAARANLVPWMFFSKALESLAGRESGEPQRVKEQAQREMDALRDAFNKRVADLEHVSGITLIFK